VTTGPDGRAAAARGPLRAAHADREQVIAVLKAAFVQGRLTKDELEARAGQTFAAKTYAELATLTADIPAVPVGLPAVPAGLPAVPAGLPAVPAGLPDTGSAAPRPTTPTRTLGLAARRSGVFLIVGVALTEGAFLTQNPFLLVLAVYAFIAVSGFLGYGIIDACQQRRSRHQRPPAPGSAWPGTPDRSARPG
jgi:hypothetical protein